MDHSHEGLRDGLLPRPTTPEEQAKQLDEIADFFELVIWHPLLLFIRWPYATVWCVHDATHDWHFLSTAGKLLFLFICIVGACSQICALVVTALYWTTSSDSLFPVAIIASVAYAVLTAVRLGIGINVSVSNP